MPWRADSEPANLPAGDRNRLSARPSQRVDARLEHLELAGQVGLVVEQRRSTLILVEVSLTTVATLRVAVAEGQARERLDDLAALEHVDA